MLNRHLVCLGKVKMIYKTILILLSLNFPYNVKCEQKIAEANLQTDKIKGTVYFKQSDGGVQVTGEITGLEEGLYGFHVHELGNVSTCDAAGGHYNPEGNNHGGREHSTRHVGDLGNVRFVCTIPDLPGIATINFTDSVIALNGTNSIIGRTLVLHEQEDDLGLGGHEFSLTTGNAGSRIACGIIREIIPGNSVKSISPSHMLFVVLATVMYISL